MIPRRSRSASTDGLPPVQFVTVCAGALRIERAHGWNDVHRASGGPVSKEGAGGSPSLLLAAVRARCDHPVSCVLQCCGRRAHRRFCVNAI